MPFPYDPRTAPGLEHVGAQADRALADHDLASLVGELSRRRVRLRGTADDLSVAGMLLGEAEQARGLLVVRS
jgi:hypothetical protein